MPLFTPGSVRATSSIATGEYCPCFSNSDAHHNSRVIEWQHEGRHKIGQKQPPQDKEPIPATWYLLPALWPWFGQQISHRTETDQHQWQATDTL